MRYQDCSPSQNSRNCGRITSIFGARKHHVVVDAGQLLNLKRNRHIRVYKGAEFVRDHALFHLDRTDLNDPVLLPG